MFFCPHLAYFWDKLNSHPMSRSVSLLPSASIYEQIIFSTVKSEKKTDTGLRYLYLVLRHNGIVKKIYLREKVYAINSEIKDKRINSTKNSAQQYGELKKAQWLNDLAKSEVSIYTVENINHSFFRFLLFQGHFSKEPIKPKRNFKTFNEPEFIQKYIIEYNREYNGSRFFIKSKKEYALLRQLIMFNKMKDIKFAAVNIKWIEEAVLFIKENVSNISNQSTLLSALKLSIKKAAMNNYMAFNLSEKIIKLIKVPQTGNNFNKFLTDDELNKLENFTFQTIKKTYYSQIDKMFLFSSYTGLALVDIINLRWIDVSNNKLSYIRKKTEKYQNRIEFQLGPKAIALLKTINNDSEYVFDRPKSNVSEDNIKKVLHSYLKKYLKQVGVNRSGITFHCARHTFAFRLLRATRDILKVAQALGHSDVKTTMIYAKYLDQEVSEGVSSIG